MAEHAPNWMPFYIGDYLRDTGRLTTEGHGAYMLLIFDYWSNGGPLPDDDSELAAITKLSPQRWKSLRPTLSRYFQIDDGKWSHKRVEAELEHAKNLTEARSRAGSKGAASRWQTHSSAIDPPLAKNGKDTLTTPSPPSVPPKGGTSSPPLRGMGRRPRDGPHNGPITTLYEGAARAADAYIQRLEGNHPPDLGDDLPPPRPLLDRR